MRNIIFYITHILIVIFMLSLPVLFRPVIAILIVLAWLIQILILDRCIFTRWQYGNHSHSRFLDYTKWFGINMSKNGYRIRNTISAILLIAIIILFHEIWEIDPIIY